MKIFCNLIFWLALFVILIFVFALTIGQMIPIEIVNGYPRIYFLNFLLLGFPIAIMLTLFGTINNGKFNKVLIVFFTLSTSVICFVVLITLTYCKFFDGWDNEKILYVSKVDKNVTINQQIYSTGSYGEHKTRTAQLKPFFRYFQIVKKINIYEIDKNEWIEKIKKDSIINKN